MFLDILSIVMKAILNASMIMPAQRKAKADVPSGLASRIFAFIATIIKDGNVTANWTICQNNVLVNSKLVALDVGTPFVFNQKIKYGSENKTGVVALKKEIVKPNNQYSYCGIL